MRACSETQVGEKTGEESVKLLAYVIEFWYNTPASCLLACESTSNSTSNNNSSTLRNPHLGPVYLSIHHLHHRHRRPHLRLRLQRSLHWTLHNHISLLPHLKLEHMRTHQRCSLQYSHRPPRHSHFERRGGGTLRASRIEMMMRFGLVLIAGSVAVAAAVVLGS